MTQVKMVWACFKKDWVKMYYEVEGVRLY